MGNTAEHLGTSGAIYSDGLLYRGACSHIGQQTVNSVRVISVEPIVWSGLGTFELYIYIYIYKIDEYLLFPITLLDDIELTILELPCINVTHYCLYIN